MSRANMTQIPDKHGSTCIFQCRDGSTRTYHYNAADSAAIAMGADPKGFSPDGDGEDEGGSGGTGGNGIGNAAQFFGDLVAEAATDAAELL